MVFFFENFILMCEYACCVTDTHLLVGCVSLCGQEICHCRLLFSALSFQIGFFLILQRLLKVCGRTVCI